MRWKSGVEKKVRQEMKVGLKRRKVESRKLNSQSKERQFNSEGKELSGEYKINASFHFSPEIRKEAKKLTI